MADSAGAVLAEVDLDFSLGRKEVPIEQAPVKRKGDYRPFDSYSFYLTPYSQPMPLVGYDPNRTRFLVRSDTDGVFIGHSETLASGGQTGLASQPNGYPVPSTAGLGEEILTTGEVWVRFNPATPPAAGVVACVSVFIERQV